MAHYAGESGIPCHRHLSQRKIGEGVRGCVSENTVPELDPRESGERTAVMTNAYSDAVPSDSVRGQHSAECNGSCKADRAKNAVPGRSINRRDNVCTGLRLRRGGSEPRWGISRRDLHELPQRSHPPHCLSAQEYELCLADVAHFVPPSVADRASSGANSRHVGLAGMRDNRMRCTTRRSSQTPCRPALVRNSFAAKLLACSARSRRCNRVALSRHLSWQPRDNRTVLRSADTSSRV